MSANTDTEGNDMNELVYILEAAQEHKELADMWFDLYSKSNDRTDWEMVMNEQGMCDGLLKAYEIVSGKKIFGFEIKDELAAIA